MPIGLLDVPNNLEIPSGREKPWGTSHALFGVSPCD